MLIIHFLLGINESFYYIYLLKGGNELLNGLIC